MQDKTESREEMQAPTLPVRQCASLPVAMKRRLRQRQDDAFQTQITLPQQPPQQHKSSKRKPRTQGCASMLTIGEACVHLILCFLREDWNSFHVNSGPMHLSRISRTCRALYIYVRNLPPFKRRTFDEGTIHVPCTQGLLPPIFLRRQPRIAIEDVYYWSAIAGVVWNLGEDLSPVLSVTGRQATADTEGAFSLGKQAQHALTHTARRKDDQQACPAPITVLSQLRISVVWSDNIEQQLALLEKIPVLYGLVLDLGEATDYPQSIYTSALFQKLREFDVVNHLGSLPHNLSMDVIARMERVALPQMATQASLQDVSSHVQALRVLSLSNHSNLTDVSSFRHLHTLNLSGCDMLTDVRALQHVHTLDLSSCERLSNVAALGRVHTLNLAHCPALTDVRNLKHVHTLSLAFCERLTNVSCLGQVHSLNLSHCTQLTDVSALARVHTLSLSSCYSLEDVSDLVSVHTLDLSWCPRVSDVSALGTSHTLNFSGCSSIKNVQGLRFVSSLDLSWCDQITNISPLAPLSLCNECRRLLGQGGIPVKDQCDGTPHHTSNYPFSFQKQRLSRSRGNSLSFSTEQQQTLSPMGDNHPRHLRLPLPILQAAHALAFRIATVLAKVPSPFHAATRHQQQEQSQIGREEEFKELEEGGTQLVGAHDRHCPSVDAKEMQGTSDATQLIDCSHPCKLNQADNGKPRRNSDNSCANDCNRNCAHGADSCCSRVSNCDPHLCCRYANQTGIQVLNLTGCAAIRDLSCVARIPAVIIDLETRSTILYGETAPFFLCVIIPLGVQAVIGLVFILLILYLFPHHAL